MRSITKLIQKIVAGAYAPDTGRTLTVRTTGGTLIATATETPAASGKYIATWSEVNAYGYYYLDGVSKTEWGKIWLGHEVGSINYLNNFISSGSVGIGILDPGIYRLYVVGDSNFNGNVSVIGAATLNNLSVIGNFNMTGPGNINISGNATVYSLTASGSLSALNSLTVQGYSYLVGGLEVGAYAGFADMFHVTGTTGLTGALNVTGTSTFTGAVQVTGSVVISGDVIVHGAFFLNTAINPLALSQSADDASTLYLSSNEGSNLRLNAGTGQLLTTIAVGSNIVNGFGTVLSLRGGNALVAGVGGSVHVRGGLGVGAVGGSVYIYPGAGSVYGNVYLNTSGSVTGLGKTCINTVSVGAQVNIGGTTNINAGYSNGEILAVGRNFNGIADVARFSNTDLTFAIGNGARVNFGITRTGEEGLDDVVLAGVGGVYERDTVFDNYAGALAFYYVPLIGSLTEGMRITSGGNLAIGKTTAMTKLDVNGSITASGSVVATSNIRAQGTFVSADGSLGRSGTISPDFTKPQTITIKNGIITSWLDNGGELLS